MFPSHDREEAIVKIVSSVIESMLSDFKEHFEDEIYKDDSDAGNSDRLTGFHSALGYTGSAQYAQPDDTYAGIDTDLGSYGGSIISGSWPAGQFDGEYDFWSPLIVNYTHADWTATTDTWADNADEVLRAGITLGAKNNSLDGQMDLIETTLDVRS